MSSSKSRARLVGGLFVLASATAIAGGGLLLPIRERRFLDAGGTRALLGTGAVLELALAAAVVAIATLLYPVLRRASESLAILYVAVRTLEGILVLAATGCALIMISAVGTGATSGVGEVLLSGRDWALRLGTLIVFGAGAVVLNAVLRRARLVPSWLAWWGLVGGALAVVRGVFELYGVSLPLAVQVVLTAPIAVEEMVFAGWLIAKGLADGVPAPREVGVPEMSPS